jgi:hypothetical protein
MPNVQTEAAVQTASTQLQPQSPTLAVLPPAAPARANAPAPKPRTRNGKVARLPKLERDMVNRMLFNNIPETTIAAALDDVGIKVTPRNISNWKTRGGFNEWCAEQERAIQVRLLQDNLIDYLRKSDASQIPEAGLQLAATHIARFFLTPEALQQLATNPQNFSRMTATLCRLAGQLHVLQKYRDDSAKELGPQNNPERIRRQDERSLENIRHTYSSKIGQGPNDLDIPYRNFMPIDR